MRYFVSDIHGEYELFRKLLVKINFSNQDEMYICGDIIDKGDSSIKLAKYISSFSNIHCIIGNHELAFLKYYHSILETSPSDFEEVLKKLQAYFSDDECLLDWDLVDWFDALPAYIESDDFICVHAGIPLDEHQRLLSLSEVSVEELVHDRRFKDPNVAHNSPQCVFFGHTPTDSICGKSKVLGYRRNSKIPPKTIKDYYKIHLDTGAWSNGVLGCICIDTLKVYYVKK
ncbi:MAG: metallophosphoesterase [Clostridia bacterium]|nr:metallophosphoesterase [Clostridia bacterium]